MANTTIILLGALGALLWWFNRSQKRRQNEQLSATYKDILTSKEFLVKGRFED